MNINLIRNKIKKCSDGVSQDNQEATKIQNQELQDFVIWLIGYMDGIENKDDYSTLKTMVDALKK